MAGIEEVARIAGVSTATVSRALAGLRGMSDATRERVLAIAAEVGYTPSPSAASLASGRTKTIGIVVPFVTRWFFANVVDAAQEELRSHGYDMLLYNLGTDDDSGRRMAAVAALRKRVDAVIVLSQSLGEDEVVELGRLGFPVAIVGAGVSGLSSVRIDDELLAYTATRHLLDNGHTRVAHIGADIDPAQHLRAPHDRLAGYARALAESGVELDERLVVSADWTMTGGAAAMKTLLALPTELRPTAVFASSDEMAAGALFAARDAGVAAPADISIIGVDDNELAVFLGLSTIRQPVREQGRIAASVLVGQLQGSTAALDEVLPTELVIRTTTGPAPGVSPITP